MAPHRDHLRHISQFVSASLGIDPAKRLLCRSIERALTPLRLDF